MTRPSKTTGFASADSAHELLIALSALATQPVGDIFYFDIPPCSQQSNKQIKDHFNVFLENEIKSKLDQYQSIFTKANSISDGHISLKVLFVIGNNEPEKDIDNMLKIFLDNFKLATNMDDSKLTDIRAQKIRINSRSGFIGISIKTGATEFTSGDLETSQVLCMTSIKQRPINTIEECLVIVKEVQNIIQARNSPFQK